MQQAEQSGPFVCRWITTINSSGPASLEADSSAIALSARIKENQMSFLPLFLATHGIEIHHQQKESNKCSQPVYMRQNRIMYFWLGQNKDQTNISTNFVSSKALK